jgi:bifunctional DNA-binding transcriptional regulator/antitoxin component of YhaV-PrlF toxin-antitoxin module
MQQRVKNQRRRGYTTLSAKNQVTIPADALARAGLRAGDRLRAHVRVAGEVVLVREADPLERFAGALSGIYERNELDGLRREWD